MVMEITAVVMGNPMFNYIGSPSTTAERAGSSPVTVLVVDSNNKIRGGAETKTIPNFEFEIQNSGK